jgi:hypothetical protein
MNTEIQKNSDNRKQDIFKASETFEKKSWFDTLNKIDKEQGFKGYDNYSIQFDKREREIITNLQNDIKRLRFDKRAKEIITDLQNDIRRLR